MRPKVIMHNQVSLDMKLTGFPVDMGTYYGIAATFGVQATITGADTLIAAMEEIPPEEPSDFEKPEVDPEDPSGYMVIVDSRGRVRGHHVLRRFEFIRDVIVLVSKSTPKEYIEFLEEGNYDYIVTGDDHVDLPEALEKLNERYGFELMRSDGGAKLNGALFKDDLIDRVSLLVTPVIVGGEGPGMFDYVLSKTELKMDDSSEIGGGLVHMIYDVIR